MTTHNKLQSGTRGGSRTDPAAAWLKAVGLAVNNTELRR